MSRYKTEILKIWHLALQTSKSLASNTEVAFYLRVITGSYVSFSFKHILFDYFMIGHYKKLLYPEGSTAVGQVT